MGLLDKFRKREESDPGQRRRELLAHGRITEGVILDHIIAPDGGEIAYYLYTLNGVDFESSELLTPEQLTNPIKYAPGAKVGIRYDPRNQGNSILE